MKVSRAWLNKHFKDPLPDTKTLAEALTFHAFEIEEYDEDMLDVKVLPDRACYGLSHRGIAYELSAILGIPMSYDQLQEAAPTFPSTDTLSVACDPKYVVRHTGALVRGVSVGPSPEWLQQSLASVGQRSINNVVDALNCVMLSTGQPAGAFDTDTFGNEGGKVKIDIRRTKEGEKIQVLTGETYELSSDMFAFTDPLTGTLLDIAGIKGGLSSGVTDKTKNLFISCGTYDPVLIRKASQTLKLFTDASQRYQNRPSPELTGYGMKHILDLVTSIAGGEVVGAVDYYPSRQQNLPVQTSLEDINARLGSSFTSKETEEVFASLKFDVAKDGTSYTITPPFYRRDIVIPEDVVEEVGRIKGYDKVPAVPLSADNSTPDNTRFYGIERIKDILIERGFVEVSTPSFGTRGVVELSNPLDKTRPYLRSTLGDNMQQALARGVQEAPRVLGPQDALQLFELGTVFTAQGEEVHLVLGYRPLTGKKKPVLEGVKDALQDLFPQKGEIQNDVYEVALPSDTLEALGEAYVPQQVALTKFKPFSQYPFAYRDIAVWVPSGTEESEVANVIYSAAGEYLTRMDLFDRFEKEGRLSLAFRLVFESFEKTLSDTELTPAMAAITASLGGKNGWEVR